LNHNFGFFLAETFPDVYMNNRHFSPSNLLYYYIFGKLTFTFAYQRHLFSSIAR
jgi:hypothetical protein